MSKYIQAALTLSTLILEIEKHIGIPAAGLKFDPEESCGIVITGKVDVSALGEGNYSDSDFKLFCERNDLNGVIFFNRDGTVTFSMAPKIPEVPETAEEKPPKPAGVRDLTFYYK